MTQPSLAAADTRNGSDHRQRRSRTATLLARSWEQRSGYWHRYVGYRCSDPPAKYTPRHAARVENPQMGYRTGLAPLGSAALRRSQPANTAAARQHQSMPLKPGRTAALPPVRANRSISAGTN